MRICRSLSLLLETQLHLPSLNLHIPFPKKQCKLFTKVLATWAASPL